MQPLSVFIDDPNALCAYAYAWHIRMSCSEIQVSNKMKKRMMSPRRFILLTRQIQTKYLVMHTQFHAISNYRPMNGF